MDERSLRTSEVFRGLKTIGSGERISLGELTTSLGDRGFGLLVLIFALPNIIPMIPGVSTVSGVVIALVGLQMMIGRHAPWMPGFVAEKSMPREQLAAMVDRTVSWVERLERVAQPRWTGMTRGPMHVVLGAMFVLLGAILALPLSWIGNFPPGVALVVLSIGMLEEDGLLVALGHAIGIVATLLVLALVAALVAAALVSFGWLTA
ncbi:exopolysaccharide biosynthesis protein [Phreatobacter oligotrophus]|uniref:exopolysaccharide biosynthesis protein n=1 Tax=Phreatobacter oligotrophus TaxID=1122261 RepID=UPI002354B7DD|nr:exopolysaccharide biosynthesis protein [Phreatobacter oligotrophus]MBX9990277.1 exopolysaccharide biosynthesis protein [Phreatobacter oligotrophus]